MDREEKLRVLKELDNLPEELYDDLLRALVETTRQQLTELVTAVEQNQIAEVRNLAHSIRGAASNLRLHELRAAVERLQQAAHQGFEGDQLMAAVAGLQESLDAVDREIT
jgi:HPt (histidine-containing phosphotransfer) domain-containing protein